MIQSDYANKDNKGAKPNNDDFACKLFIGGLSTVTTEDSMRLFYEQWGQVVDAVVLRDPATKRSRGFGFITYANPSMVDKAQAARPHNLDGKNVDSKRALPRPELIKSEVKEVKKIFVGGLKDNHDEESLREHFSQFGNVVDVKILLDKATNRKRGFAFVEFDDYDAVDKAVLHKNHTIRYVLVDVKKSVYKQELAKKIAVQQANGMMHQNAVPVSGAQVGYQQQIGGYNGQAAFASGYPAQLQQPYNNWNGYTQPGAPPQAVYQQAPPAGNFGQYPAAQQNGSVAWNGSSYTPGWAQNGYIGQQAAPGNQGVAGGSNGWNNNPGQNFGDYQQAYNGGPQKVTNLQGNRMNPYNVTAAANFGI